MSAPSYDEARAEYQRRYAEWHRLQHDYAAAWREGRAPGIPALTALSDAERALRAASGAMHRAAGTPSRRMAPVCPTIPERHPRRQTAVVHCVAALLAGLAGWLIGNRH